MSEQSHSELHGQERALVEIMENVKIVGYREFTVPEDAVIAGETWKALGAGLSTEGGELVVVENPVTNDRLVIRGDHLRSTEHYVPDPATKKMGTEAVEQVIALPTHVESSVRSVRIIEGAQE